ncbi:MAG: hypothetical protein ACOC80_09680 [Petrotogales bacterium]
MSEQLSFMVSDKLAKKIDREYELRGFLSRSEYLKYCIQKDLERHGRNDD